ncbi:hypothetical protein GDO86_010691, partial [Hymenochirus boettgeri]
PKSCQIRDRRILHGFGEKTPPHCSVDGTFLPVQCKLLNTTDNMAIDVVSSFNRFSGAFTSFTSLREAFPEISGYCYCADSLGRELAGTGIELLLGEVYDTIFAGLSPPGTFTQTAIYRILQRRFLGLRLITSGKFRCPSVCEVQRFSSSQTGDIHVPACDVNGDFKSLQCQTGGQCWCVDSKGQEIDGTRKYGDLPSCDVGDCSSKRRQALASLFYGPVGPFEKKSLFATEEDELKTQIKQKFCPSYVIDTFIKSGLLPVRKIDDKKFDLGNFMGDMVKGLFPSKEMMQVALNFSLKNFQENLFGGKYLKNIGSFNFTGAVGTESKFNFSDFFKQIGLTGTYSGGNFRELAKLFSSEEDSYLNKESFNVSKPSFNLNQPIQGDFGNIINLQDNQNLLNAFSSVLEMEEFSLFLQELISFPPYIAHDVSEAAKLVIRSTNCEKRNSEVFIPICTKDGKYESIQCSKIECWCVDDQGREIPRTRIQGKHPRCPSKCEKERERQISTKKTLPAGSELFIPTCDLKGHYITVQCVGKHCFCVDLEGRTIPGTQKVSGENIQCPSLCQLGAARAFLETTNSFFTDSTPPQLSNVYVPQCTDEGQWKPVQCSGPTEQAFQLYESWTRLTNFTFSETLSIMLRYKNFSSLSFSAFVEELYGNRHQNVFPVFIKYPTFNDVPMGILNEDFVSPADNILLNPHVFWRLLTDRLTYYPGPYTDFSLPLTHLDLRNCWCVDLEGQKLKETDVFQKKFPKCPTTCELAKLKSIQFMEETRNLTTLPTKSALPWGQSFLMAYGIRLTESEVFHPEGAFGSGMTLSDTFMKRDNYAIQLAALSMLQFYWKRRFALNRSFGEGSEVSYLPYVPQCDGLGNWEPVQNYESTGHYWCVDEDGNYIGDSLVKRTSHPPLCQTPCQRHQTNAQVSNWMLERWSPQSQSLDVFVPVCTETGLYSTLQKSDRKFWCLTPHSGKIILQAEKDLNSNVKCPSVCSSLKSAVETRDVGVGFLPVCDAKEDFSLVQCDQGRNMCFCVFSDGEEVPGTQVNVSGTGKFPSCKSPVCHFPFGATNIRHGTVFCEEVSEAGTTFQKCHLFCRKGYKDVFPADSFVCNLETQLWGVHSPHPNVCQKIQPLQTVQTQAKFQLLLPPGKKCMADYSGLLQVFGTFILDDLRARGLCQVQTNNFGSGDDGAVTVCDDSSVHVECLSTDRLGVKVTWRAQLEDISGSSVTTLRDIENVLIGEDFIGRFTALIRSGNYSLSLDSKQFVADVSVSFPHDVDSGISPKISLGCTKGFWKVNTTRGGCVICPSGSSARDNGCSPCPVGFYQDKAGSNECTKCPLKTTTPYAGAYRKSQCLSSCQMNNIGLLCDSNGQYLPSQKDLRANRFYCIDPSGVRLNWTESGTELTNAQCLLFGKFQLVPENKLIITDEDSRIAQTKRGQSLLDCITECAMNEMCDYIAVSVDGKLLCDHYNGNESNIVCTDTKQEKGILGNSESIKVENLICKFKIKGSTDSHTVYNKKGHEFSRTGQSVFEKTDYGNSISGTYKTWVFSAEDLDLNDVHLFCSQECKKDSCCDGFILSQNILSKGTILCGLLNTPDFLLCNVNDWSGTSLLGNNGVCKGVKSNKELKMFSFFLGGQEFTESYSVLSESIGKVEYNTELTSEAKEEIQERFVTFQRVFLRTGSRLGGESDCSPGIPRGENSPPIPDLATDLFHPLDGNTVTIKEEVNISSQQYGISRKLFVSKDALLWCLTRCIEEESWCRLSDLQETTKEFFTCVLYPDTRKCKNLPGPPDPCEITLRNKPQLLYKKKEMLGKTVKHFYKLLPFRRLTDISIRNRIIMTGKSVSMGFFECELHCDADPCCKGFGYMQTGMETLCVTLNSLGIQSCSDRPRNQWRVMNCIVGETMGPHPFGWFQKPEDQQSLISTPCPPVDVPHPTQEDPDNWLTLQSNSVIIDPSLSAYDIIHVSIDSPNNLSAAQNYCLAVCSRNPSCVTTTVDIQKTELRCLFYPETQSCVYGLKNHHCQILTKKTATVIFQRKRSVPSHPLTLVAISHGTLLGKSEAVLIGSYRKNVVRFLGIPYASPPVGNHRFSPPQPFNWTGTWNATASRASCLQPGDGKVQYSSVGEDCLYLNIFVPQNIGTKSAVILYFHNSPSDYSEKGQTVIDGSYLAATGNIIVVTASYRVGVFGFLSSAGRTVPGGNWGLLDQVAAMKYVQENIVYFGGDPGLITIAADREGANTASLHMVVPETKKPFRRALLMGGSAFSPMLAISEKRAQEQVRFLAAEVGCPSSDNNDILTCLQLVDSENLNSAQTKRFEEAEGRADSKMAFYQALQNSLGGEEVNPFLQDAAVWFYSLEHSTDDYSGFSRALENATRDHFIACPIVKMAKHWSKNSNGGVFMYHVPDTFSQMSVSLDLPEDVLYVFGLPFHTNYKPQFSSEEQKLSLKVMQYIANFVKTGNPNFPYSFSRKVARDLPAWPRHLPHSDGDNYKEFSSSLNNNQGLKRSQCSFWNDYIPSLKRSTRLKGQLLSTQKSIEDPFPSNVAQTPPKPDKKGYN